MEIVDTFKNRLRYALDKSNMIQQTLAERAGIGKSLMSQYLSGDKTPGRIEKFVMMAELLNVSTAWLAGFDVPMENVPFTDEATAIVKVFNRLNPVGRRKVKDYIEDLADNEKYLNVSADYAELKRA